jgi:hypothetical protein
MVSTPELSRDDMMKPEFKLLGTAEGFVKTQSENWVTPNTEGTAEGFVNTSNTEEEEEELTKNISQPD